MKSSTIALLLVAAVALPSGFAPASATKMNGKCCQSSDGGRSHRYRMAMKRSSYSGRQTGGMQRIYPYGATLLP